MNGGTLQWNGTNTQDISARLTLVAAKTTTLDTNGNNVTLGTTFGGGLATGGLIKTGTGTLTLTVNESFSGGVTVNGGTLKLNAGGWYINPFGSTNLVTINSGGTLQTNGAHSLGVDSNSVFVNGGTLQLAAENYITTLHMAGGSVTGGELRTWGGTMTFDASATGSTISSPNFNLVGSATLQVADGAAASDLLISGAISNTNGITKTGAGTLTLSGTNTYTGGTTINGGTVELTGGAAQADSNAVTLANTAGVVLKLNNSETIGSLAGGGTTGGTVNLQANTLTAGDSTNTSFAGVISGTGGAITKAGSGTLTLSGTNTYTGATSVNAGVLAINGDQSAATGAVTVSNADTKLMGTGTVGGSITINTGAILAPGNAAVGTVGLSNNLTLNSGSIFEWEIGSTPAETGRGTNYDAVNLAGTMGGTGGILRVVLNGSQTFTDAFWDTNRTWTDIFTGSNGITVTSNWTNAFSNVQYYNSSTGDLGTQPTQGYFTMSGNNLSWTAVPEPTSALAGILLGAGLLRRRRAIR